MVFWFISSPFWLVYGRGCSKVFKNMTHENESYLWRHYSTLLWRPPKSEKMHGLFSLVILLNFLWADRHYEAKRYAARCFSFTELYRKVRRFTISQKSRTRTENARISAWLVGNLSFFRSRDGNWCYWYRGTNFVLFISWWVTYLSLNWASIIFFHTFHKCKRK